MHTEHEVVLDSLLTIPEFSFSDDIIHSILYLNKFRDHGLTGSTPARLFYVVKQLFEIIETVGSSRIEGNNTTVIDYIENGKRNKDSENYKEISNILAAQNYIVEHFKGEKLSKRLICEVHALIVNELEREGARHIGQYRQVDVEIGKASFKPPSHFEVERLMDKLIDFVNADDGEQYAIIKIAIFHHAFTYIHPFDNGNGRVVRLLTLVLLLQFDFQIHLIFNPSAVFYLDRANYYAMLSSADNGNNEGWIRYFSEGLMQHFKTVEKLADYRYLFDEVITPSIQHATTEGSINADEQAVLLQILSDDDINIYQFKAGDIKGLDDRRRTYLIKQLRDKGIITPLKERGREYRLDMGFFNVQLFKQLRSLDMVGID